MNECLGDEVAGGEVDDTDVVGVDHTFGSCDNLSGDKEQEYFAETG